MQIAVNAIVTVIGLVAVIYAFNSERFRFNILNHLPGLLGERKVVFIIGFAIVLVSFGLAYVIAPFHELIGVAGGWLMLLGSVEWFNLRIVRKLFAPVETKVIRITMFSGVIIACLSTGMLFFPPAFSPGGFLMGVSVAILAGRLWWNEDLGYLSHTAKHSKRDYF